MEAVDASMATARAGTTGPTVAAAPGPSAAAPPPSAAAAGPSAATPGPAATPPPSTPPPVDDAEQEAVRRCQAGDKDAFEVLVRRHMKRAAAFALGLTGNREEALDVSQEAFVRAYRAIGGFDPSRPFYPWLHGILRNACLTRLGRRTRRAEVPLLDGLEHGGGPEATSAVPGGPASVSADLDPQAALERAELRRTVWGALERLRETDREILVLREFLDLQYAEIAAILEIPTGTVMSRLHSARGRLRAELSNDEVVTP